MDEATRGCRQTDLLDVDEAVGAGDADVLAARRGCDRCCAEGAAAQRAGRMRRQASRRAGAPGGRGLEAAAGHGSGGVARPTAACNGRGGAKSVVNAENGRKGNDGWRGRPSGERAVV